MPVSQRIAALSYSPQMTVKRCVNLRSNVRLVSDNGVRKYSMGVAYGASLGAIPKPLKASQCQIDYTVYENSSDESEEN